MANVKLSELPAAGAAPVAADRLAGVQVSGPTDKTWTIANIFTSPAATTSITTGSTTFALLNTTATTVNAFGAATTLNIGASATCILNFGGSTTASEFRFLEPSGSGTNYTAFKAQAQGASITYTLPATVGAAGTVLTDSAGNGTLSWTAAGAGTVTVVGAGSLTSTALVTGGGTTTLQTPSATATMDTSGNIATPGSLSTGVGGSVAGNIALTQGSAPSAGTTNVTIYAPVSVTSYVIALPGAAATGFYLGTNSSGTVTMTQVAASGTGNVALTTSPSFTTPVLGTPTSGTLTNCSGLKTAVKVTASNYTVGTTDPTELYGGVIYATGAITITIPAVVAGASFSVVTVGANAVSVDPNASDLIIRDGVSQADGEKVTNTSTTGDIAVFTYYDATGWYCSSNSWTNGG